MLHSIFVRRIDPHSGRKMDFSEPCAPIAKANDTLANNK